MDGMKDEYWPGKGYPSSAMEHHIDQYAVGIRIDQLPSPLSIWIKDDSALINERQLDAIAYVNCDTGVCSRCGDPDCREIGTTHNKTNLTKDLSLGIIHNKVARPWQKALARMRLEEWRDYEQAMLDYKTYGGDEPLRPTAYSLESTLNTVKLCQDCCLARYEREFETFVTRNEDLIETALNLGFRPEAPRTISGQGPTETEWVHIVVPKA